GVRGHFGMLGHSIVAGPDPWCGSRAVRSSAEPGVVFAARRLVRRGSAWFPCDETRKADKAEELARLCPAPRLCLQGSAEIRTDLVHHGQCISATVNERQHVVRLICLHVAMATRAHDLESSCPEKSRQAPHQPGIVEEVGLDRLDAVLERIPFTERDGCRGVVPVEDSERASRDE